MLAMHSQGCSLVRPIEAVNALRKHITWNSKSGVLQKWKMTGRRMKSQICENLHFRRHTFRPFLKSKHAPIPQSCVTTTHYFPSYHVFLTTHYSLLIPHSSLLTTRFSLLTTHYSLLSSCYVCLTPHFSLLTSHCLLLTTYSWLLTHHSSLLTNH